MRFFSSVLAALFALAVVSPQQASALPSGSDFSGSTEYHLVACKSKSELDCVATFGFLNSAGKYISATESGQGGGGQYIDMNGNTVYPQSTSWEAVVDGKKVSASLDVPLQTPKCILWKSPDGTFHYGASLRPWVSSNNLLDLNVRFEIRTSYLIPQNVQLVANDADFKQTKIAGGNLWMFQGKGTPVSNYTSGYGQPDHQDWTAKADEDTSTLHFIIHHGDPDLTRGYWPAECGDQGYTVQAFNSNSAGSPSWDQVSESLNFAIVSPHTMASGKPNVGFFKLWTTDNYINCKWPGNTLASSPNITVHVISEDGVEQASVNQVEHKNGMIFVSATGFHYSAPTIKIVADKDPAQAASATPTQSAIPNPSHSATPSPSASSATTSASSKSGKITCVSKSKPLRVKTLTAGAKCPNGFKVR